MTPLVEMRKVTKEYRGVAAVKDIDFTLMEGEVHGLVGENGAGKSTLTKLLAGVTVATSGTILLQGETVSFSTPAEAVGRGVAMVFQETSLVPSMTVAQNLYLGDERFFNQLRRLYNSAQQFLQTLNFEVDPWAMVSTLGAAKKQMVEIARAVRQNVKVIIFDEPTAALTPEEKGHFFSLVARLKLRGVSVIFISHALEEALAIADRITILRDGQRVRTDDAKNLDRELIIRAMVGRSLTGELYSRNETGAATRSRGRKVLSVQNLSMGKAVRNTSFSIFAGQITGVFGLIGSGRTEAAKIIAGVLKRNFFYGGEILLEGKPIRYRVPRPAILDGIAYVTEDRKVEGYFETMSIAENIQMGNLAVNRKRSVVVRMGEMQELASHWQKALSIRAINGNARVVELSGGNQQKVVIAKSLVQLPKLVIFDEPTRGVDVGAIAEIHHLMHELASQGLAVMMISSYLPEVMNVSDRILICRQGRIVEEFSPNGATEEELMYAAVH